MKAEFESDSDQSSSEDSYSENESSENESSDNESSEDESTEQNDATTEEEEEVVFLAKTDSKKKKKYKSPSKSKQSVEERQQELYESVRKGKAEFHKKPLTNEQLLKVKELACSENTRAAAGLAKKCKCSVDVIQFLIHELRENNKEVTAKWEANKKKFAENMLQKRIAKKSQATVSDVPKKATETAADVLGFDVFAKKPDSDAPETKKKNKRVISDDEEPKKKQKEEEIIILRDEPVVIPPVVIPPTPAPTVIPPTPAPELMESSRANYFTFIENLMCQDDTEMFNYLPGFKKANVLDQLEQARGAWFRFHQTMYEVIPALTRDVDLQEMAGKLGDAGF